MEGQNTLVRKLAGIPRIYSARYLLRKQFSPASVVPNILLNFATFPNNLLSFSSDSILPIFSYKTASHNRYITSLHIINIH